MEGGIMSLSVSLLTLQFLAWVEARPRTYAEARQAWRSTCPTTCAWEDAISDGLIEFETGSGRLADGSRVVLSSRGRSVLNRAAVVSRPPAPHIAAQ